MKVEVEAYGTRMGNNNITEAIQKKQFGLRFDIVDDDKGVIKISFVLSADEADKLADRIWAVLGEIDNVKAL